MKVMYGVSSLYNALANNYHFDFGKTLTDNPNYDVPNNKIRNLCMGVS